MTSAVSASAFTSVGSTRRLNEDSVIARMPIFLVADGMGGHARGERASQETVRVFDERFPADGHATTDDVLDAVAAANAAVRALSAESDSGASVAGTTLSGLVRVFAGDGAEEHWMVVNVGDSRVYTWDGRDLVQLSVDHSVVQELLDAGEITAEEAAVHPERHVITRALGADAQVDVDVWLLPVGGDQTFLVCSDGLCDGLDDARIAAILAGTETISHPSADIAERLVDAAVLGGSRDNVSAVVVESRPAPAGGADRTQDRLSDELVDTRPRG